MNERTLVLSKELKLHFRVCNEQTAEIIRERSYINGIVRNGRSRTLLTLDQISQYKENLEWLESQLLQAEKSAYDNPVDRDFESYGDGEC